jgi:anionic cell wall polymer biosynthesis LytR-Cps2A-Psr (LCP) family protein
MAGFSELIDAVGGVTIRVEDDLPIGQSGKVLEAGLRKLTGYEALWYARSRSGSNDYDRMGRQRCVLGAMARELDPGTVLQNFTALTDASSGMVTTNIPQQQLPQLVDVAWKVKDLPITSLQLVPPLIVPAEPDFGVISDEVDAALDSARAAARDAESNGAGTGEAATSASSDGAEQEETSGSESTGDSEASEDEAVPIAEIGDVCSYE